MIKFILTFRVIIHSLINIYIFWHYNVYQRNSTSLLEACLFCLYDLWMLFFYLLVVHHYCLIVEIIIHTLFVYWYFSVQSSLTFLFILNFIIGLLKFIIHVINLFFFSYVAELSTSNKYSRFLFNSIEIVIVIVSNNRAVPCMGLGSRLYLPFWGSAIVFNYSCNSD